MATTSYSNWNFHNQRVQQEVNGGQFISAETTLIAAGPPSLQNVNIYNEGATTSNVTAYPIGLLESFGLQQNKQLQRIFEIGSSRSYFIPGRVIGSIALGRTFYFGPSLLRVLYATYSGDQNGIVFNALENAGPSTYNPARNPGEDNFFIDLASDLFSQPTGMAVYFKSYQGHSMGAFYLEGCYIQGHKLSVSSGSVLIMEGAQLQYDQLVPIQMTQGSNEDTSFATFGNI